MKNKLEQYNEKTIKVATTYGKIYVGECFVEYDDETNEPYLTIEEESVIQAVFEKEIKSIEII